MDKEKLNEIEKQFDWSVKKCIYSRCNAEIPRDALYCPTCGSRQVPWASEVRPPLLDRKCPHCNKQLYDSDIHICSHCAGILDSPKTSSPPKTSSSQESRLPPVRTSSRQKYLEDEEDDDDDIGFTHYNDLYAKKSYRQSEFEKSQKMYKNLSREEREKIYKKHAINPCLGLLVIPINMVIYLLLDGGSFDDLFKMGDAIILLFLISLVLSMPIVYLFAMIAINHNKEWRHKLSSYDLKRDAKDTAAIVALGVATKGAVKNSKDLVTKPLKPEEAHF